ncbi:MAG: hypothetical protein R6W68_01750 [Ignavibacteriaceae bacterium]
MGKAKKFLFNFLLLLLISLYTASCNSVEPPSDGNGVDTTSHNFTFQNWTFGEHSGSTLYDVAIINDTSIWAVGEIYMNDSLGQPDTQPFAIAHWNGSNWSLIKVPYHDFNQTIKYPGPLFSVAYIDNYIYAVSYANLLKWTGSDWEEKAFFMKQIPFDGQVTKMWGIDENNIYCVGRNGAIYFFFGSNWQQITSGTTLNINDIWGITDEYGIKFILCPAYNFASGGEKKLISISGSTVGEIPWVENRELYTVWFNTRDKIYAGGEGLFYRTDNQWTEETLPELFKFRVRGSASNDIWTVGGFGFAAHYNGETWKTFDEVSLASGNYRGLAVKGNTVVMTGNEGIQAVMTIGRRL